MCFEKGSKSIPEASQSTVSGHVEGVVSCGLGNAAGLDLDMVRDMKGIPSVSNMHKLLIAQELIKNGWTKSN